MKLEEEIIDYEEIQKPKLHWFLDFITEVICRVIAFFMIIPVFILLCFNVDPLGIKSKLQQDEDKTSAQRG